MQLYFTPRTRATRPRWLLEELGVPYDLVRVDLTGGQGRTPEYRRKVHPHGAVPALCDGDLTIIESAGICMYLADKYADRGLIPAPGTPERGRYFQWMAYATATLEPALLRVARHAKLPAGAQPEEALAEERRKLYDSLAVLDGAVQGGRFLLGDRFTAVDVLIGSMCAWADRLGHLAVRPALREYVARVTDRDAYRRAMAD